MPVHLDSPYPPAGATSLWLRGNIHTHSTRSDGHLPAEEVLRRYADMGYDFLALTDHDVVSNYTHLDAHGMVLIQGNEITRGAPHMLDIGATRLFSAYSSHQTLIDEINANGGFAIVCHPNWEADFNHYPYEMLATLTGYLGIEIYNGGGYHFEGSHLAVDKWDRLLASGRKVWAFANDDTHRLRDFGCGWNVVAAPERSHDAIVSALRSGSFYASSGVVIEKIECEGATVRVVAPNAQQIDLVGKSGRRIAIEKGPSLEFDLSEAPDPYFRIECYGKPGEQAWSQPIYIRGGAHDDQQRRLATLNALQKSVLHAYHADAALQLTGTLSDPIWQKAEVFSKFRDLRDGTPAPVQTHVQAIIVESSIYFGIRCDEPDLEKIVADPEKALWVTDSVEIFLDPEGRGASCWQLGINAAGNTSSMSRGVSIGTAPAVEGKVGRYGDGSKRGWSAELVIPLGSVQPSKGSRWGLHICRNRQPVQAHFVWSWVGKSNHNREEYGSLIL